MENDSEEYSNNNYYLAKEDFKRVDHIIYVSLKYTKTVDMMRNGIDRMISTMYYLREYLLCLAYEKNLIENIPKIEVYKGNLLKKLINLEEFDEFISFYRKIRKIVKSDFTKHCEFRKHMCMMIEDDEYGTVKVGTEEVLNFFEKLNGYMKLIKKIEEENFFITQ